MQCLPMKLDMCDFTFHFRGPGWKKKGMTGPGADEPTPMYMESLRDLELHIMSRHPYNESASRI
jgi:hypothetical protein